MACLNGVSLVLEVMLSWLLAPTPVWLSLCVIAACGGLAWRLWLVTRRADRHARSIAHMDAWADSTDHALQQIEIRTRRLQSSSLASRQGDDAPKWWQK